MSQDKGLYTQGSDAFEAKINSIPLNGVDNPTEASIGSLVSDATAQISTLVRSEIELAKAETTQEVKKGVMGAAFFAVAATVALYSSFLFFFFLAELLSVWLHRWAAFLIVFLVMLLLAGVFALFGVKKFKQLQAPKKTIDSVTELKDLVPGNAAENIEKKDRGLYS
ncbi:MAG: phage holin family protein [Corynebacterium sp.]|nr:phage holin family protein [Corynebacterium sp.]